MDHTDSPQPLTDGPLTEAEAAARARQLVEEAYRPAPAIPTSYRDMAPVPYVGETPPVAQPGRPPMSQRATDASALLLTGSVATVAAGGSVSLVLLALGTVDPVTIGVGAGGGSVLLLALAALITRLGRAAHAAAPAVHHHTYNGPVTQTSTNITSHTRGLGRTHNNNGPKEGR
ncbi:MULTISPECIES: hypothetical protein [Streptomyces]|uniref:Uncharacterized protein n=1 Tax=Streptomyces evansiae TaxID=3075535 RepID=A0ABU2R8M8_9ACTN|nr:MULTISPECIES: hypothetical protein [unclassified Streptomyces]MDT0412747.1 hypothetical protein [Streptomyces sp. DSM 41979]MYQ56441.1 hypothetical protein [Streptomyces sp. SID4926]SCE48330.1 hypothetical protein GA0115252_152928 [Streptomyces sp. DfronAA-171]